MDLSKAKWETTVGINEELEAKVSWSYHGSIDGYRGVIEIKERAYPALTPLECVEFKGRTVPEAMVRAAEWLEEYSEKLKAVR